MKKTGKKLAFLLAAVMVLSLLLTACGKKDVSGTYTGSYDMKDELNAQLAEAGLELQGDLSANFILVLKEDNTFTFDIDAEGFSEKLVSAIQDQGESMVKAMLDEEGITEDMYQWIAEASGYDDFSSFVDGLVDEMITGMGDEMVESLKQEVAFDGTYEVGKDTITLESTSNGETMIDEGEIYSDGSIFISSQFEDRTLNITFTKQS
ncbi:MAG: hypothetical protein IKE31_04130 [Eubacterium sp.]|nr:hypothetical protein [Eubacterium sp.]